MDRWFTGEAFSSRHFYTFSLFLLNYSVLRIRDIFVRIRIRILGSVPWRTDLDPGGSKTYGSVPGPGCVSGTLVHLHHSSKIKIMKKSQNWRNQGFSYYFCLMMEGSGVGPGAESVLVTNGSGCGSGKPKNIRSWCESGSATLELLYVFGALLSSLPTVYQTAVKWC
jgi:hypothetical protein